MMSDDGSASAADGTADDVGKDGVWAWSEEIANKITSATSVDEILRLVEGATTVAEEEAVPVPENELLTILDGLWARFDEVVLPTTGRSALDLVASAWLASVFRQARAVGVLIRQDMRDAGVPNARVALEHAIYLSLIADAPDLDAILETLELRSVSAWSEHFGKIPDAKVVLPFLATIAADLDVPKEMAWVKRVEQVCEKLETGPVVYTAYRSLTSEMHPGPLSAIAYMLPSLQSGNIAKEPASFVAKQALQLAVAACVWAGWSADALFGVELFGPVVGKAAERLHFIPLKRLVD
jgi:hypothetical protein